MTELPREERLAIDIDTRLLDLWNEAFTPGSRLALVLETSEELRNVFAAFLRAAYGKGYSDALREDRNGHRAELHRTHGYRPE